MNARWVWPALVAVAAGGFVALWLAVSAEPAFDMVDRPLPDLPARTLDGVALTAAALGDGPALVLVWLPG